MEGRVLGVLLLVALLCAGAKGFECEELQYHLGEFSNYRPMTDEAIQQYARHQPKNGGNEHNIKEECTLIQFQYVSRHGARYPFGSMVTKFLRLQEKLSRVSESADLPPFLRHWDGSLFTSHPTYGDLSDRGVAETNALAQRMVESYPGLRDLLDWQRSGQDWNSEDYRFESSQYIHTARSASSFGYGLFHSKDSTNSTPYMPLYIENSAEVTKRLTAYNELQAQCEAVRELGKAVDHGSQAKKILLEQTAARLASEWGTEPDWKISASDVSTMWQICAFEATMEENCSSFCSLFDDHDLVAFERSRDISAYYQESYGFPPSYECMSPLLQEVFAFMDKRIHRPETSQKVVVRFAHHQTISALLSLLNVFNELDKHADNLYDLNSQFPWSSSRFTPFMGHVAFFLYDCGEEHESRNIPSRYFVSLSVNEKEVAVPGTAVYCPYAHFWRQFSDALKDSMESVCKRYQKIARKQPELEEFPEERVHPHILQETKTNNSSFFELYIVLIIFVGGIVLGLFGRLVVDRSLCRFSTKRRNRRGLP